MDMDGDCDQAIKSELKVTLSKMKGATSTTALTINPLSKLHINKPLMNLHGRICNSCKYMIMIFRKGHFCFVTVDRGTYLYYLIRTHYVL